MNNIHNEFILTHNYGDNIYSSISSNFHPFGKSQDGTFYDNEETIASKAIFQSQNITSIEIKEEKKEEIKEKEKQNEIKPIEKKETEIFIIDETNKSKNKNGLNEGTKANVNKETVKEENNVKGIFHLFTKRFDDKNDIIKDYSEKPPFKDSDLKKNKLRLNDMDNTSKKVRGQFSKKVKNIFRELEIISFKEFNQDGNKIRNKAHLSMSLKEILINIFIQNKKKENNDYILTEDDKKFIESLAKNDERKRYILNMKMEDIYKEFFESQEYQDLIKKQRDKGKDYYYIFTFIENNKRFIEYYKNAKE